MNGEIKVKVDFKNHSATATMIYTPVVNERSYTVSYESRVIGVIVSMDFNINLIRIISEDFGNLFFTLNGFDCYMGVTSDPQQINFVCTVDKPMNVDECDKWLAENFATLDIKKKTPCNEVKRHSEEETT